MTFFVTIRRIARNAFLFPEFEIRALIELHDLTFRKKKKSEFIVEYMILTAACCFIGDHFLNTEGFSLRMLFENIP